MICCFYTKGSISNCFVVRQVANGLQIFLRKKQHDTTGHWVTFSNFTISVNYHSVNDLERLGKLYVLTCCVKGTKSQTTFDVFLTKSDCGKQSLLMKKFSDAMKNYDGFLNVDCKEANLKSFVYQKICEYDALPDKSKQEAVVIDRLGEFTVETSHGPRKIFAIGRNQLVALSNKVPLDSYTLLTTCPSLPDRYISGPSALRSASGFINSEIAYHDINAGSILSLHGYSVLSMNRSGLEKNKLKIGACSIFGNGLTGKSKAADHLCMTFPRNGQNMEPRKDCKMSCPLLIPELAKTRPPIIQDHPTDDWKPLNQLLDLFYEGSLPKNTLSRSIGDIPQTGLVLVWSNEQVKLQDLDKTALTKGFYLYHQHQAEDRDFIAQEHNINQLSDEASAIFSTYLKQPNWAEILRLQAEKIKAYKMALNAKCGHELAENPRVLINYALLHATVLDWIKRSKFILEVDVDTMLTDYYINTCIPKVFEKIEVWKSNQRVLSSVYDHVPLRMIKE